MQDTRNPPIPAALSQLAELFAQHRKTHKTGKGYKYPESLMAAAVKLAVQENSVGRVAVTIGLNGGSLWGWKKKMDKDRQKPYARRLRLQRDESSKDIGLPINLKSNNTASILFLSGVQMTIPLQDALPWLTTLVQRHEMDETDLPRVREPKYAARP